MELFRLWGFRAVVAISIRYAPRVFRALFFFPGAFNKGVCFMGSGFNCPRLASIQFNGTFKIGRNFSAQSFQKQQIILGKSISIRDNVLFDCVGLLSDPVRGKLRVGNNVGISDGCSFFVRGDIEIGNDTIFGPNVKIFSENHVYASGLITRNQKCISAPVIIGQNCWIGSDVIILPGVELGSNCVVGAGSILSGTYPSNSVIYGQKAKVKGCV